MQNNKNGYEMSLELISWALFLSQNSLCIEPEPMAGPEAPGAYNGGLLPWPIQFRAALPVRSSVGRPGHAS